MKNILCKINRFFKNNCSIAVLDEAAGRWLVKSEPKNLPYLKAENANGRHILVKPDQHIQEYYLLVDDFAYALALFRRGLTQTEIAHRIIAERQNWSSHASPEKVKNYLNRTLTKACKIISQN